MVCIKPTYKIVEREFDAVNIGTITRAKNQRKIRTGVVNAIANQLAVGKHFETAICVNERKDIGERVLDGGHRILAMEKHFKKHPKDTIKVELHVYTNLTDDQEKKVYATVNKGTKQSTNDFIRQFRDDIAIFKAMRNGWREQGVNHVFATKVTTYPSPSSLSFFALAGAYFAVTAKTFSGGYMGKPEDFVADTMHLGVKELKDMHAFLRDFELAFGKANGRNSFAKGTPLTALMKIWLDNYASHSPAIMVRGFQKLVGDPGIVQLMSSGGYRAVITIHPVMLAVMNTGRLRAKFQ